MHIVVVGNPENRRIDFFRKAVDCLNLPAPKVISYNDLLDGKISLPDVLRPETILRIESPGENFEVEKKLIMRGIGVSAEESPYTDSSAGLLPDPGRIRFLKYWYLGFNDLLKQLQQDIATSHCRVMNQPKAIALMFNKPACQQHLEHNGISVPEILPNIQSYHELKEYMASNQVNRVFIKPAHASSASGVIAYRRQDRREEAVSSIELILQNKDHRLYNSLKVRSYTNSDEIGVLIDFILNEGAIIEKWIPKASMEGQFFDVRIVVINEKSRFILPRLSKHPITNLHLGNKRGDVLLLRKTLGEETYEQLLDVASASVRTIKGAFYAGVDTLIPAGMGKPRILELNAFGDLLPGLLHEGFDTYTTTLKEFIHAA